jgi:hypothetical protein
MAQLPEDDTSKCGQTFDPKKCGQSFDPKQPARKVNPPPEKLRIETVKWLTRFAQRLQKGRGK